MTTAIPKLPFIRSLIYLVSLAGLGPVGMASSLTETEPTFSQVNQALGFNLLADTNFWDDPIVAVADRLGWPEESLTTSSSSFRAYPEEEERILGVRPRSQALYGDLGFPSEISIVFANKGDAVAPELSLGNSDQVRQRQRQIDNVQRHIREEDKQLQATLTALLGDPVTERLGQGSSRETARRWDWRGHVFLLTAPRHEYVALRIRPATKVELVARIADADLREVLASQVVRRPNGDVVLSDIPMVNQGPKGYCVPATWERVMRYMGVPADMYVLAMAANTSEGGGTSLADISWGAKAAIRQAGRRVDRISLRLTTRRVAKYIDQGLPVMWGMFSTEDFNQAAEGRMKSRLTMEDPALWAKELEGAREAAKDFQADAVAGHLCLITGYNEATGELALSDSWGPAFRERWVTEEEAQEVSQNSFYVIKF